MTKSPAENILPYRYLSAGQTLQVVPKKWAPLLVAGFAVLPGIAWYQKDWTTSGWNVLLPVATGLILLGGFLMAVYARSIHFDLATRRFTMKHGATPFKKSTTGPTQALTLAVGNYKGHRSSRTVNGPHYEGAYLMWFLEFVTSDRKQEMRFWEAGDEKATWAEAWRWKNEIGCTVKDVTEWQVVNNRIVKNHPGNFNQTRPA